MAFDSPDGWKKCVLIIDGKHIRIGTDLESMTFFSAGLYEPVAVSLVDINADSNAYAIMKPDHSYMNPPISKRRRFIKFLEKILNLKAEGK